MVLWHLFDLLLFWIGGSEDMSNPRLGTFLSYHVTRMSHSPYISIILLMFINSLTITVHASFCFYKTIHDTLKWGFPWSDQTPQFFPIESFTVTFTLTVYLSLVSPFFFPPFAYKIRLFWFFMSWPPNLPRFLPDLVRHRPPVLL